MKNQSKYGLNNFLRIAESYTSPDTTTAEGIEKAMIAWYAFKFETTLNDPKLLDMTVEELLVLYYMHKIKDNPDILKEKTEEDDWEEWLKSEMDDNYETDGQMVSTIEKEAEEYTRKVRAQFGELPDQITTDFGILDALEDDNG